MRVRGYLAVLALALAIGIPWVRSGGALEESRERLSKGPVVGDVRTDRATVTWVTVREVGSLQKAGAARSAVEEPVYHRVELDGLQPATSYQFSLASAETAVSFTTAPAGDAPFMFIVNGDNRTRHDVHRKVVGRILGEKPSFLLNVGDLVADGTKPADWDTFFDVERELLRQVPFYPVLGNHERNTPVFGRYFAVPGGDPHHYSFDWGAAHFVGLDTNEVGNSPQQKALFLQGQAEWLRDDLRRSNQPFLFVFYHHPLYTAVERRREGAAKLAEVFEPVLLDSGVSATFAGHDHNYQHHLVKGLHHIVTGGGGAPLYDVSPIPGITLKAFKTENYVRARIAGGKALVEAVDLQGNVLDSFELTPRAAVKKAA